MVADWATLTKLLKKGNHLSLPAAYELDNTGLNWTTTFFDYLATDPAQNGGTAFELEYTIPDTIIIKQRRAYAWLTGNKSAIARKDKISELQPKFILEGFCASYSRHMGGTVHAHTVLAYLVVTKQPDADHPHPTPVTEYFTLSMLQRYLFERLRTDDRCGILQLFIAPPGNRNCVIRAWWTPHSLRIEQRANTNDLRYTASACMQISTFLYTHTHTHVLRYSTDECINTCINAYSHVRASARPICLQATERAHLTDPGGTLKSKTCTATTCVMRWQSSWNG